MSRAYKDGLLDQMVDAGGLGFDDPTITERLSGADLAQALLAAKNGSLVVVDAGDLAAGKALGSNLAFGKLSAELSGADQERFAGTQ